MGCENSKKVMETIRTIRTTVLDRLGRVESETKEMQDHVKQVRDAHQESIDKNKKVECLTFFTIIGNL